MTRWLTITLFFLVIIPVPSLAQDCLDYSQNTHWISSQNFGGQAGGIAIAGNYAYVSNHEFLPVGIQIFDITDPHNLVPVGATPLPGTRYDIAVAGNYAYTTSSSGLEVINVQDPANPFVTGVAGTPGNAWRLAVQGGYAYVADYDSGLAIVICTGTSPFTDLARSSAASRASLAYRSRTAGSLTSARIETYRLPSEFRSTEYPHPPAASSSRTAVTTGCPDSATVVAPIASRATKNRIAGNNQRLVDTCRLLSSPCEQAIRVTRY